MSDAVTVAISIRNILFTFANSIAKKSFIKRERKVTGSNFLRSLLFAFMGNTSPSESALARSGFANGLKISPQGLEKRYTQKSAEFLKEILDKALEEVFISNKILNIYIRKTV